MEFKSKNFLPFLQNFINTQFKEDNEIHEINFYEIYHNSDVRVPIICSFPETDVDPLIEIYDLASEIGFQEENVKCIPFIETQVSYDSNVRLTKTVLGFCLLFLCKRKT